MTYNAADRKDVRRAEKDSRVAAKQEAEVVVNLMSTTAGRRWVFERLADAGVFRTTFVAGDPYGSAFAEGMRNSGLALLAQVMAHCPDQFTLAQQEANVRDTVTEQRGSADPDGGDQGSEPSSGADADFDWRAAAAGATGGG